MEVKCKYCGYEWETKTKLVFVSCPSCLKKNKVNSEDSNPIKHEKPMEKKEVNWKQLIKEYK